MMWAGYRLTLFVWGLIFSAMPPTVVRAEPVLVTIEYVAPADRQYQKIYERAKDIQLLERAAEFFQKFRLPRPLALRIVECGGDPNAFYENDAVSICYEYIQYIADIARSKNRPQNLSEADAIRGPVVEVLLHEGGHAIFDYLHIPVLGKEEDAADQLAALGLLSFDTDTSRKLIGGIVYMYRTEGGFRNIRQLNRKRVKIVNAIEAADEHSTPLQRMYSALCLAAGSGKKDFADLAREAGLPPERAELCPGEYAQVVYAFRTLILPHIDQEKIPAARQLEWFRSNR
jgi:hypothetical protein